MKSHDTVYSINKVKDHPSRMYIKKKGILYSYLKSSKEMFERIKKLKKIYIRSGSMYFFRKENIYNKNFYGKKIFGVEVKNKYKINIDKKEDLLLARKYINDLDQQ